MVRALLRGGDTRGGLLFSIVVPGATLNLLDLLQAHGLTREGTAEARISQEKTQPLKVSSTGKVESWANSRPPELAQESAGPARRRGREWVSVPLAQALHSKVIHSSLADTHC